MRLALASFSLALLALGAPATARDSLGIFGNWGAFRDPQVPRCYAIAKPLPNDQKHEFAPFAAIGTWPRAGVRTQLDFRLARKVATNSRITVRVGTAYFTLTGSGNNAWPTNAQDDARIIRAIRAAGSMTVFAHDTHGQRFTDRYNLDGVATAIDAATIGCAKLQGGSSGR